MTTAINNSKTIKGREQHIDRWSGMATSKVTEGLKRGQQVKDKDSNTRGQVRI